MLSASAPRPITGTSTYSPAIRRPTIRSERRNTWSSRGVSGAARRPPASGRIGPSPQRRSQDTRRATNGRARSQRATAVRLHGEQCKGEESHAASRASRQRPPGARKREAVEQPPGLAAVPLDPALDGSGRRVAEAVTRRRRRLEVEERLEDSQRSRERPQGLGAAGQGQDLVPIERVRQEPFRVHVLAEPGAEAVLEGDVEAEVDEGVLVAEAPRLAGRSQGDAPVVQLAERNRKESRAARPEPVQLQDAPAGTGERAGVLGSLEQLEAQRFHDARGL